MLVVCSRSFVHSPCSIALTSLPRMRNLFTVTQSKHICWKAITTKFNRRFVLIK